MPRKLNHSCTESRLIAEHGDGLGELLRRLYTVELLSFRQLSKRFGLSAMNAVLWRKLLARYDIEIRKGSVAIAAQWARDPERRHGVGVVRFSEMVRGRAAAGLHWAKGHTKHTHPGLAGVSRKLAESGRLVRRDVVARSRRSYKLSLRDDPSWSAQMRVAPVPAEAEFMRWLESRGTEFVFQYPIPVAESCMFVDFMLPASRLVVELCKYSGRFRLSRARAIAAAGFTPLGIPNTQVLGGVRQNVQDLIARAERGQFHPSTLRECWMAIRPGNRPAAEELDLDQPIR